MLALIANIFSDRAVTERNAYSNLVEQLKLKKTVEPDKLRQFRSRSMCRHHGQGQHIYNSQSHEKYKSQVENA